MCTSSITLGPHVLWQLACLCLFVPWLVIIPRDCICLPVSSTTGREPLRLGVGSLK